MQAGTAASGNDAAHYLVGHLEEALALDPRVSEQGLCVSVEEGVVVVTGIASTPERRDAVAAVAAEVAPDHEVRNEVTVADYRDTDEAEAVG